MRFIGSKAALLKNIEQAINENTDGNEEVFCDLFSGTALVAQYFKPRYEVHSNDLLYFSFAIQKATIENNRIPDFAKLRKLGLCDPLAFLEEAKFEFTPFDNEQNFISQNYSPSSNCQRMYFSNKNAARIDFIRNTIEAWKNAALLSEAEYFYLLASLIEAVPFVSNITGTYGAYLKHWDKRAFKDFEMLRLPVVDNGRGNKSYNCDANRLIRELQGDILYLDPPYNSRQYSPNYHVLETIAKNDKPDIEGVTGMRPYADEKSAYCVRREVYEAFEDLIASANFSNILLSYSNDGLMTSGQIEACLKKHGLAESFKRYDIPHRKYKSKIVKEGEALKEYIFFIKKSVRRARYSSLSVPKKACVISPIAVQKPEVNALSDFKPNAQKKYLKSPLNYVGGKYRLLAQLLPHFPVGIANFIDLFAGAANVGINVNANRVICNDINSKVIEIFHRFQQTPIEEILKQIHETIARFALSKTNEAGFMQLREHYNATRDPIDLYTLSCFSFNYQFRFNNRHEYNNPFGKNRSQFSEALQSNLLAFVNRIQKTDITFTIQDFTKFDLSFLGPQDMVYCDPPYLITTGSYNDGNRGFKNWTEKEELLLYDLLDTLDAKHIRFALSNVIFHKGKTNHHLEEWSKKYRIIELNFNYANSSYNTGRGNSREVLIINY